ncbi:hypothetical protein ACFLU8_00775 [Chloroflexota bacterium]
MLYRWNDSYASQTIRFDDKLPRGCLAEFASEHSEAAHDVIIAG